MGWSFCQLHLKQTNLISSLPLKIVGNSMMLPTLDPRYCSFCEPGVCNLHGLVKKKKKWQCTCKKNLGANLPFVGGVFQDFKSDFSPICLWKVESFSVGRRTNQHPVWTARLLLWPQQEATAHFCQWRLQCGAALWSFFSELSNILNINTKVFSLLLTGCGSDWSAFSVIEGSSNHLPSSLKGPHLSTRFLCALSLMYTWGKKHPIWHVRWEKC